MMLLEYRKELSRSYLIAKGVSTEKVKEYQYKMIVNNRIRGLLPCSERNVEGEIYLYYDITSKQSLQQLYESKKLGFRDILNLVEDILHILESIAEYLLEEKYLLLDPRYIFFDLETERPSCVFYPYAENISADPGIYEKLAEFLLEHVDHTQERAVNAAYQFYKHSKSEFFALQTFMPFLNKEKGAMDGDEISLGADQDTEVQFKREPISLDEGLNTDEEKAEKEKERHFPFGLLAGFVMSGMCTGAAIGYLLYCRPEGETGILIHGITAAAGAVFVLSGWRLIRDLWKKQEEEAMPEHEEEIYPIWSPCEEVKDAEAYGETVYLGRRAESAGGTAAVPKLTGRLGKKETAFLLDHLPMTVGKLEGRAEIVLQEASVSRVHAQIVDKDGRISLMDMNSTNGTFLNGIRLEQGEVLGLEDGDEIRFGRSVFRFEFSEG